MAEPEIVTTVPELQAHLRTWKRDGATIGLVPTMGALHEGHLSLVRDMAGRAAKVVVSIFVNPAQFAPHEDFDRYPRARADDTAKLAGTAAVSLVFAPGVREIYPDGFATRIDVDGPGAGLETDFRPHFFSGVATVVAKLLLASTPDFAIFGEKDYQQLQVIRRLVADLALPIEIVGGAIVREADGLAMSSRNAYLKPDERRIAGQLNRILKDVATKVRAGAAIVDTEKAAAAALLAAGFASVDYVAVRDAGTLAETKTLSRPARVLAAAKIGATRLIDNWAV
jgi:pantoate--beta-alanine ligase